MSHLFQKHYTTDEARALLPSLRAKLEQLKTLRRELTRQEEQIAAILTQGRDAGGKIVNRGIRMLAEMNGIVKEFARNEIQIKDIDRGLIDFPAIRAGKEVFLCWELDEEDIEFWHDLTSGYEGRERLRE